MAAPLLQIPGLDAARSRVRQALLGARDGSGYWTGELSNSALSTATAATALAVAGAQRPDFAAEFAVLAGRGLKWLVAHQNADGGWGDTTRSSSNISTTALGWAAFGATPGADQEFHRTVNGAAGWLEKHAGSLAPDALADAIIARYGRDRTFSVPILTMCALAGRLGPGRAAWARVLPLPFELAAVPHQCFAALRLPVVSYALPALIAIGQARHFHRPSANPVTRLIRNGTRRRTLAVLESIQPPNGGFLEATPLTSFVVMSLAGSGQIDHAVTRRGLEFLRASVRPDGSWPIDTNLATWVTTLAINALGAACGEVFSRAEVHSVREWLLRQQTPMEHPYTHAARGAWAWTDLPGGVPDADDTAGALLALRHLLPQSDEAHAAVRQGVKWLVNLQNRDGGIPTFCRGWGALPFDRSGADLTAHAVRAWLAWRRDLPAPEAARIGVALERALRFLANSQRADGSWLPLWFGNQYAPGDENPVYGTARVVAALSEAVAHEDFLDSKPVLARGLGWLVINQNADGSWGHDGSGAGTIEETALGVEALALAARGMARERGIADALRRGANWLIGRIECGTWEEPAPIGFYFAKLWYFERMYPLVFTAGALERLAEL